MSCQILNIVIRFYYIYFFLMELQCLPYSAIEIIYSFRFIDVHICV